jgi:hypothetical protein
MQQQQQQEEEEYVDSRYFIFHFVLSPPPKQSCYLRHKNRRSVIPPKYHLYGILRLPPESAFSGCPKEYAYFSERVCILFRKRMHTFSKEYAYLMRSVFSLDFFKRLKGIKRIKELKGIKRLKELKGI